MSRIWTWASQVQGYPGAADSASPEYREVLGVILIGLYEYKLRWEQEQQIRKPGADHVDDTAESPMRTVSDGDAFVAMATRAGWRCRCKHDELEYVSHRADRADRDREDGDRQDGNRAFIVTMRCKKCAHENKFDTSMFEL